MTGLNLFEKHQFEQNIYPKCNSAVPLILPFKNQDNWFVFGVTVLRQLKSAIDTVAFGSLFYGAFFCILIRILTH